MKLLFKINYVDLNSIFFQYFFINFTQKIKVSVEKISHKTKTCFASIRIEKNMNRLILEEAQLDHYGGKC